MKHQWRNIVVNVRSLVGDFEHCVDNVAIKIMSNMNFRALKKVIDNYFV